MNAKLLGLLIVPCTLLQGCAGTATTLGARTLDPGQRELVTAFQATNGDRSIVETGLGLPIGFQFQASRQFGVAPDLDVGTTVSVGGLAGNVRYRFARSGRLHAAIVPSVGLSGVPSSLGFVGSADVRTVLIGEAELTPRWSLSASVGPRLRVTGMLGKVDDLSVSIAQPDLYVDYGLRSHWHGRHAGFALAADMFSDPVRHSRLGVGVSAQLTFSFDPWKKHLQRDSKRFKKDK